MLLANGDITHVDDADAIGKKVGDTININGVKGTVLNDQQAKNLFAQKGKDLVDSPIKARSRPKQLEANKVYKTNEFGYVG